MSSFETGVLYYTGTNVKTFGSIPNQVISVSGEYALDNVGQIWNIGSSTVVSSGLPLGYGILQSTPNGFYLCGSSGIYSVAQSKQVFNGNVSFARFESGQGYFGGLGYYGVFETSASSYTTYSLPFELTPVDGVYGVGMIGCTNLTFGNNIIASYVDSNNLMVATTSGITTYHNGTSAQFSLNLSSSVAICPFISTSGYAVADAGNSRLILQGNTISIPGLEPFITPSSDYATVVVATSSQVMTYSSTGRILDLNLPGTFVSANGLPNYAVVLATSGALLLSYIGLFNYSFTAISQPGTSAAVSNSGEVLISNSGTLYLFDNSGDLLNEYPISAEVESFAF